MRILAILVMTMTVALAVDPDESPVEWVENDLPVEVSEDVQKMVNSQIKIIDEADQELMKLRDKFVRSLKCDLRKYERKNDEKAVAAIKALIEAQTTIIRIEAGEVIASGLPVDPENDIKDLFDMRTPEERRAAYEAQKEWENANLSSRDGKVHFRIRSHNNINLKEVDEFDGNENISIDISELLKIGPYLNPQNSFDNRFPDYKDKIVIDSLIVWEFKINSNGMTKGKPHVTSKGHLIIPEGNNINLLEYITN